MSGAVHRARVASSGAVLAERLRLAHTPWARLRGLLGTKGLNPGEGLWLRPCRQLHMSGMRSAVDAVFLDARQRGVRALPDVAPGRGSPHVRDAGSVLELPAGTVERAGLAEGTQVVIEGEPVAPLTGRGGRLATAFSNLALAALYALFVAAHISRARGPVDVALAGHLAIIVQMTILAVLFVVRRPSTDTSDRPLDWVLGIVGTFLPLLLRRADTPGGLVWLGGPIQVGGASAVAVVALFLGRSFALVSRDRGRPTPPARRRCPRSRRGPPQRTIRLRARSAPSSSSAASWCSRSRTGSTPTSGATCAMGRTRSRRAPCPPRRPTRTRRWGTHGSTTRTWPSPPSDGSSTTWGRPA